LLTSLAGISQNHPTIPELSPFVPRFSFKRTDRTNLVVTSHA
jgi:hypothetical protein